MARLLYHPKLRTKYSSQTLTIKFLQTISVSPDRQQISLNLGIFFVSLNLISVIISRACTYPLFLKIYHLYCKHCCKIMPHHLLNIWDRIVKIASKFSRSLQQWSFCRLLCSLIKLPVYRAVRNFYCITRQYQSLMPFKTQLGRCVPGIKVLQNGMFVESENIVH